MREVCRNFQRGSCQYGERCRYLHVLQQQRKSNVPGFGAHNSSHQQQNANPFGFGSHTGSRQQQKTNPYGFGMQNNSQSKGATDFEIKQHQFKPFENKWTRPSSSPQNGASRQSGNHSQVGDHKCTDPEICKGVIAEDFQHEKPLWTLTCYSHCKGAPCDIVGDISYEELRAAAYEDSKRGMGLQSIVERERNLLNSKLVEFEKLLHEPYRMPPNSSLTNQYQSLGVNANPFSRTAQNTDPLSVSSFSQLGASLNMGLERRSSTPLKNTLVQPSPFESEGNSLISNTISLSDRSRSGAQSSSYFTSAEQAMFPSSTTQQSSWASNGSTSSAVFQASTSVQSSKSSVENGSRDVSIWLKEKWNPGEIPEEAPPDAYVR